MMTISSRNGLLQALGLLKETGPDTDEVKRQRKMQNAANAIRGSSMSEEEDDAKADDSGEKEDKKSSDSGSSKPDDKKKPKDLPGSKELKDNPPKIPNVITGLSVIDRINKIRAGSSMKNDKVMKAIDGYVTSLSTSQSQDMYTYLDALARIILADMDPSEVPVPRQAKGAKAVEPKKANTAIVKGKPKKGASTAEVPIVTLAEGVKRKLKEVDVPVRNGKLVPFGSKSHIADLEARIDDLERIRSYQEAGSDSRHVMGLAIKALKSQLRAAEKMNGFGNPRVQPVPPIVEKEK